MGNDFSQLDGLIDAIADRVLQKLRGVSRPGPADEPSLPRPDLPWGRQDVPALVFQPRLRVQGLEVTQSIQYYGTGYGVDNSVPIVALKPMVVRAFPYVTAGLLEGDALSGKTVTGELALFRWGKEVYRTSPTRPAGARVGAESELDRDLWDSESTLHYAGGNRGFEVAEIARNPPLNFPVPAWYVRAGQTTAVVRLWLTSNEGGVATTSETFQVVAVNAPKLALVRVNWKNTTNNVVTSPSDSDLLRLSGLAVRMLPFPYFETTILGVEQTKSGDFSAAPAMKGGCNTAWTDLLTDLKVTRMFAALFQIADIVYGVVPQIGAVTTVGTLNTGCGWGDDGVGGCLVDDQVAFAHEVGHLYDCGHVGDPTLASYDPNYPNYGGSKTSIGEVGIDTALGGAPLSDPGNVNDLMSYRWPRWVSPYTYLKILDNRDKHSSVAADPRSLRPVLIVSFTVERRADGSRALDKIKAHVVQGPGHLLARSDATSHGWSIDLVYRHDRILASQSCRIPVSTGGGCGCGKGTFDLDQAPQLDFVEAMEWPEDVARLELRRGETQVASLPVGEAPHVELKRLERHEGSIRLHVRVDHPRAPPSLAVLFTGNDGESWLPVAIDPEQTEPVIVETSSLPGGETCRFRLVATAEFRASTVDSEPFSMPRRSRGLVIDVKARPCEPGWVDLRAMVDGRGHGGVAPDEIVWHSDLAGELGRGYALSVQLEHGRHRVTASIPGGARDRVQEAGIIVVGGRDI